MRINIRIIYRGYTSKLMQRASFPVDPFEFQIDPDKEAARIAYEWLKQIKREVTVNEIEGVIYNDKQDITELVRKFDNALPPLDNLPF